MRRTIATLGLIIAIPAFGQPVLFSRCPNVRINPVPNGAGVYMSEDCKTAYVLPPAVGSMAVDSIVQNVNLQNCQVMNSLFKVKADQAKRIEAISAQVRALEGGSRDGTGACDDSELFSCDDNQPPRDSSAAEERLKQAIDDEQAIAAKLDASLAAYEKLEGFSAHILLTADQQAQVNAYQKANPQVHFEPLTPSEARLTFIRKDQGAQGQQNAVLSTTVTGLKTLPGFPDTGGEGGLLFNGALSGQVVLSMAGACPFYDAARNELISKKLTGAQIGGALAASVTYEYNLSVNRSYTAEYNIASFFHRLQSSESHGGIFTSSTVNRLIVEKKSDDWFKWHSNVEDGRYDLDDSLRETVKAQLIDRAFKQIVLVNGGAPDAAPGLATPKPDGASVAAKNLQKCPYVYCQIGAAVLEVADAIFGSSSAVSEYIESQNYWASDTSDENKALPFLGTIAFGG